MRCDILFPMSWTRVRAGIAVTGALIAASPLVLLAKWDGVETALFFIGMALAGAFPFAVYFYVVRTPIGTVVVGSLLGAVTIWAYVENMALGLVVAARSGGHRLRRGCVLRLGRDGRRASPRACLARVLAPLR